MPAPEPIPDASGYVTVTPEEIFELKRTLLILLLAVVPAALQPMKAVGQEGPETAPGPAQAANPKYEAYLGLAYSRIRQVPDSFSGLLGGKATLSRDFGKYFQLMGSGDYYRVGTGHHNQPSPGNPSVYSFLVGPAVHTTVWGKLSGLVFAEVGVEHTAGENMTPSFSFAGGFGGGLTYNLYHSLAVQLTGDRVAASFPLPNNNTEGQAGSTHRTWNARGTIGVVYRFSGFRF